MRMLIKTLFFIFAPLVLAACTLGNSNNVTKGLPIVSQKIVPTVAVQADMPSVTIVLDFGNGKIATYSNILGKTAFEVLQEMASKNNISLEIKQYDFGVFIKSIGGLENTKDLSWIYFVDGKSAEVASDKYELHNGDRVEWKYTKPNY